MRCFCLWFLVVVAVPVIANAEEPTDDGSGGDASDHPPIHNRLNFRIGFDSANKDGRTQVCLDVNIAFGFSAGDLTPSVRKMRPAVVARSRVCHGGSCPDVAKIAVLRVVVAGGGSRSSRS